MSGKRRRPPPAARREQILLGAARLIGQVGYYGFSLQNLASNEGLTVAGVLYHFSTKTELLVALLQDRDAQDTDAILAKLTAEQRDRPDKMTLSAVRNILREIVMRNSQQPEIVRLFSMLRTEALFADHPAYDFFEARDRMTCQTMLALLTDKIANPQATIFQMLALMEGLEHRWLRDPDGFDFVGQWDLAMDKIMPVIDSAPGAAFAHGRGKKAR